MFFKHSEEEAFYETASMQLTHVKHIRNLRNPCEAHP